MPKCDFHTSAWVSPANLLHIFRTPFLDPMQDGLFCGCSRMAGGGGGQKGLHPLKFATHILQWWNLASYTLHKKEPKNIWITWHTPCVVLTSAFFHRKSANLAIFKNTDIDCILAHNLRFFKLFLSLRRFFNKHGYNFDNVSKIGFSSAS